MSDTARLTEKTIAGLGWTSLAMGAQAVLQIVALIFLARLLAPEQFGLFAAAMVIGGFCAIFSDLGVSPAIVQRPDLELRHVRTGFTLSVILSLAVGGAAFHWADEIAGFFRMPDLGDVVRIMAFGFPLQGLSTVAQSLALRAFRFRWLALLDAAAFAIGFLIVAPILSLFDFGVYALAGAYLTQQVVRSVVLLFRQPHAKLPMLQFRAMRELLYFGAGFTMAKVANYFATQADNLVVGRWLGAAALGIYANAYQLMASPASLFGQVLDRVLFPTMASVQKEPERLARAYRSGLFTCATVMLPVSALVAILAPEITRLLLGPNWSEVAVPLRILAFGMLFRTSYKISDTVARATGAVYARAWRQAIYAAAVVLFAIIGQFWGLAGVASGVVLALALVFFMMAQLSLRLIGMGWADFARAHGPGLVMAAIVGTFCLVSATWLRNLGFGSFLVVVGVTLTAALAAIAMFWARPQYFFGPDGRRLIGALANVAPRAMKGRVAVLQKRVSG